MRTPTKTIRWLVWLIALAVSAMGLRHYRVDNNLAEWMPDQVAPGPFPSYAVIGFERDAIDANRLAADLRTRPSVALCIDPLLVSTAGRFADITPDAFVIGEGGDYLGIFAFRHAGASDQDLIEDVERCLVGIDRDRCALAGPAVFHLALNEASQQRLPIITGSIVLLGALLLWIATGRLVIAIIAMVAVTMSQLILLGLMSWRGLPVDMATSMVPPLIMSLGFSYAAHRATGRSSWTTLILCLATTAIGLATFFFSGIAPLRSFALNGICGLILVWLAVMTLVPRSSGVSPAGRFRPVLAANIRWVMANPRWVLLGWACILIAAAWLATQLRFETNPLNYFPPASRVVQDFTQLDQRLTGMLPFQITARGPGDPQPLLRTTPGVRKVIDVSSFIGTDEQNLWCLADNTALPDLAAAQSSWRDWALANDTTLEWRGVAAQLHETGRLLLTTAYASLPAMAFVAAVVVGLVVRSWRLALVGMLVNLVPVVGFVMVAGILRWPLDLPSLMIGAISIGVAIDDTLHLVRSYVRYGSVKRAMLACWRPCVGSSMVAAACMCLFAISPFGPTAQFGIFMAVAIIFALSGDFLLLPILIKSNRSRQRDAAIGRSGRCDCISETVRHG